MKKFLQITVSAINTDMTESVMYFQPENPETLERLLLMLYKAQSETKAQIHDLELAYEYREEAKKWEKLMMELVGEDGFGSVKEAIVRLKNQAKNANN